MNNMEVKIEGMSCDHCVKHVKEALLKVKGVKKADVSLKNNSAVIQGDFDPDLIRKSISEAGYKAV